MYSNSAAPWLGGSGATKTSTTGTTTSSTYTRADQPPALNNRPHVGSGRHDPTCSTVLLLVGAPPAITGGAHS